MIVVTVELRSARGREFDRLLGVGTISNIGGNEKYGAYKVSLSKMAPKERQEWRGGTALADRALCEWVEGDVVEFDRERRGGWDLLYLALKAIVGGRNP